MITFFDIPSKVPKTSWSPNLRKTRLCLNYKGLPYKTVYVEYPDIEEVSKKHNFKPTGKKGDGSPLYTLPAILDDATGAAVSESFAIAEYLDKAYPDTPRLIPAGTEGLQDAFSAAIAPALLPLRMFVLPSTFHILNKKSGDYFRPTREKLLGKTLEEATPKGDDRVAAWSKAKDGFAIIDSWLKRNTTNGPYVMGDTVSFSDFVLAASIGWTKIVLGEDSEEWKDLKTWHEGRWFKMLDSFEKYEHVE